ncbi:hypothetical protein [Anaerotignum propionicum]|uniref:hypothetical protein n=1 Tax=Anaerotignum propionicum TaxID=28446 RepID=UPI0028970D75|nr:hypothetical protein [Anaerotignum propionicum]
MTWEEKKTIFKVLVWCGIYGILGGLWEFMELMFYGQTRPSFEDTIISIITTFAIYGLIMKWIIFRD